MSRSGGPSPDLPALDAPEQIAELVRRFYREVAQDELLGPVFHDAARVDWAEHLPELTAFWCRALLGTPGYAGNPLAAHRRVDRLAPFTPELFERWLELFEDAVDEGWSGPHAERAKRFARTVAGAHAAQLARARDPIPPGPVNARSARAPAAGYGARQTSLLSRGDATKEDDRVRSRR